MRSTLHTCPAACLNPNPNHSLADGNFSSESRKLRGEVGQFIKDHPTYDQFWYPAVALGFESVDALAKHYAQPGVYADEPQIHALALLKDIVVHLLEYRAGELREVLEINPMGCNGQMSMLRTGSEKGQDNAGTHWAYLKPVPAERFAVLQTELEAGNPCVEKLNERIAAQIADIQSIEAKIQKVKDAAPKTKTEKQV